ncbi:MAG: hypothetical protein R2708_24595 [Vicinamibacterales bacterium]
MTASESACVSLVHLVGAAREVHGQRLLDALELPRRGRERRRHDVRAGGHGRPQLEPLVGRVHVQLVGRLAHDLAVPGQRPRHPGGAAAHGEALHAHAVDADVERLRMAHPDDVVVDLPAQAQPNV